MKFSKEVLEGVVSTVTLVLYAPILLGFYLYNRFIKDNSNSNVLDDADELKVPENWHFLQATKYLTRDVETFKREFWNLMIERRIFEENDRSDVWHILLSHCIDFTIPVVCERGTRYDSLNEKLRDLFCHPKKYLSDITLESFDYYYENDDLIRWIVKYSRPSFVLKYEDGRVVKVNNNIETYKKYFELKDLLKQISYHFESEKLLHFITKSEAKIEELEELKTLYTNRYKLPNVSVENFKLKTITDRWLVAEALQGSELLKSGTNLHLTDAEYHLLVVYWKEDKDYVTYKNDGLNYLRMNAYLNILNKQKQL